MFVVQMIDKLYCFSAVVAEMNTKYSGFPQKLLPHTPGAHAWTSGTQAALYDARGTDVVDASLTVVSVCSSRGERRVAGDKTLTSRGVNRVQRNQKLRIWNRS